MSNSNERMINRALFIDFDLYAENDLDFKMELIELMVENLHELQQACCYSIEQNNPEHFGRACHKVKTTLSMLADTEYDAIVEELKNSSVDQGRVSFFNKLTVEIITSLLNEKRLSTRTGTN